MFNADKAATLGRHAMRLATLAWCFGLHCALGLFGSGSGSNLDGSSERERVAGSEYELASARPSARRFVGAPRSRAVGAPSRSARSAAARAGARAATGRSASAASESPPGRAGGVEPAELSLVEIAAYAREWTVAVRADRNYGAAVVLDRAGLVLTNQHVIESARSITVTPLGGRPRRAEVLDSDSELDLALLRVPGGVPPAGAAGEGARAATRVSLGSARSLAAGDEVLAVGSPRRMHFSVCHGLVAFARRLIDGIEYIQTDAPINVGNSGGPLFDRQARVVGVISFVLRGSQGVSFALPIDRALARFARHLRGAEPAHAERHEHGAPPSASPASAGLAAASEALP